MQKTFEKSLYISSSSDLFVALSPSVRRLRERGWKQKKWDTDIIKGKHDLAHTKKKCNSSTIKTNYKSSTPCTMTKFKVTRQHLGLYEPLRRLEGVVEDER